jgi:hypothetical protein
MQLKNNGLNRRAFLGAAGLLTMNASLVRGFQANSAVIERLRGLARTHLAAALGISSTWATNWNDPSYSITDSLSRAETVCPCLCR